MGEQHAVKFPQEVLDEYAALGIDLPALFSAGHLGERMDIRILEASADRVVATMPVEGNTQPYGLLHGGASAVLAETLGSIGAMMHGGINKIAVGVDLNCTHHRGARSGIVTGVATPCTGAARPPPSRSSSPTSRTGGSAPPASPASCATSSRPPRGLTPAARPALPGPARLAPAPPDRPGPPARTAADPGLRAFPDGSRPPTARNPPVRTLDGDICCVTEGHRLPSPHGDHATHGPVRRPHPPRGARPDRMHILRAHPRGGFREPFRRPRLRSPSPVQVCTSLVSYWAKEDSPGYEMVRSGLGAEGPVQRPVRDPRGRGGRRSRRGANCRAGQGT